MNESVERRLQVKEISDTIGAKFIPRLASMLASGMPIIPVKYHGRVDHGDGLPFYHFHGLKATSRDGARVWEETGDFCAVVFGCNGRDVDSPFGYTFVPDCKFNVDYLERIKYAPVMVANKETGKIDQKKRDPKVNPPLFERMDGEDAGVDALIDSLIDNPAFIQKIKDKMAGRRTGE